MRSYLAIFGLMLSISCASAQVVEIRPPQAVFYESFGWALTEVPDMDGDGVSDLVVGAPHVGEIAYGSAYAFSGTTGECLGVLEASLRIGDFDSYGCSVVGLADLDGDMLGDFVIGAGSQQTPDGAAGGLSHVYSGGELAYVRLLDFGGGGFGLCASRLPDADEDGYDDLVIGAPYGGALGMGRAVIVSGRTGALLHSLEATDWSSFASEPQGVSGVPDVDGDDAGDVVVGARAATVGELATAGCAFVYSGRSGALIHVLTSPSPVRQGLFGHTVAGLPDLDGDGFGDVAVSSAESLPNEPRGAGLVYLFSGTDASLIRVLSSPHSGTGGAFGRSLASVPDVNGDTVSDLIVGSSEQLPGFPARAGAAYVFCGRSGRLLRVLTSPNAQLNGWFGYTAGGIADINGDLLGEVLVGAPSETYDYDAPDSGTTYLFLSCRADFNGDNTVNSSDFFDFLSAFFADDADFNHSGVTDSQDFFDYLVEFFRGCP